MTFFEWYVVIASSFALILMVGLCVRVKELEDVFQEFISALEESSRQVQKEFDRRG